MIKHFFVFVAGVALLGLAYAVYSSLSPTKLILGDSHLEFDGIPTTKTNTNIIIVHGIGDHCIGYADRMISSLVEAPDETWISEAYEDYYNDASNKIKAQSTQYEQGETIQFETIYLLRNSKCNIDFDNAPMIEKLKRGNKKFIDSYDYLSKGENDGSKITRQDSIVRSQEKLCDFIHRKNYQARQEGRVNKVGSVTTDCYKLYVRNKRLQHYDSEKYPNASVYVTGFIVEKSILTDELNTLRVLELTWSPATRWIKSTLRAPENFNETVNWAWLNARVKSNVVNSSIADAVAYLSDSGILINFNLLQAFCLVLNPSPELPESDNKFSCNQSHLSSVSADYAAKNNTVLVSHSLGTKVTFDTLGLLSNIGVEGSENHPQGSQHLTDSIFSKFGKINAAIPAEYSLDFTEKLKNTIPHFIDSIHSFFVFTNQIPLLAANITSPLDLDMGQPNLTFGAGFENFLSLRKNPEKIQIVSFHDPDDVLSYNLKCWFQTSVLKYDSKVRERVRTAVENRIQKPGDYASTMRDLRGNVFEICSRDQFEGDNADKDWSILEKLWETQERFNLQDASVRLRSNKIIGLVADPRGVHSNYFTDAKIHHWMKNGYSSKK